LTAIERRWPRGTATTMPREPSVTLRADGIYVINFVPCGILREVWLLPEVSNRAAVLEMGECAIAIPEVKESLARVKVGLPAERPGDAA
jgi:hypothetical protein